VPDSRESGTNGHHEKKKKKISASSTIVRCRRESFLQRENFSALEMGGRLSCVREGGGAGEKFSSRKDSVRRRTCR